MAPCRKQRPAISNTSEAEADTRANRIDAALRDAGRGIVEDSRVHRELICPSCIMRPPCSWA